MRGARLSFKLASRYRNDSASGVSGASCGSYVASANSLSSHAGAAGDAAAVRDERDDESDEVWGCWRCRGCNNARRATDGTCAAAAYNAATYGTRSLFPATRSTRQPGCRRRGSPLIAGRRTAGEAERVRAVPWTVPVLEATSLGPTIRRRSCWRGRLSGWRKDSRICRYESAAAFAAGESQLGTTCRRHRRGAHAADASADSSGTLLTPSKPLRPPPLAQPLLPTRTTTTSSRPMPRPRPMPTSPSDVVVTSTSPGRPRGTSRRTTGRRIAAPAPTPAGNARSAARRNNSLQQNIFFL